MKQPPGRSILPDATLGLLGGGQLGRMFALAAHELGYRVAVLDPDEGSPAGLIAELHIQAPYADAAGLRQLTKACPAITTEFESVPAEALQLLAASRIVRPSHTSVAIAQDRIREKLFLTQNGFAVAPFVVINSAEDCEQIDDDLFPAIIKRARFGYDGKGQSQVRNRDAVRKAFLELGGRPCVLEKRLELEKEISVVVVRGFNGDMRTFPVAENRHRNGILDISIVPAAVSQKVCERADEVARAVAQSLDYCGVLTVEFFVVEGRDLVINEIAPRPHNSGHYTIDACAVSQFEQQVRALCGLPLGDTKLRSPIVMVNLLGDLWEGTQPAWEAVLARDEAKLHLYGKHEARPGRKMGHFTVAGTSAADALQKALAIRAQLRPDLNDFLGWSMNAA